MPQTKAVVNEGEAVQGPRVHTPNVSATASEAVRRQGPPPIRPSILL